jgi:hypothetical protein
MKKGLRAKDYIAIKSAIVGGWDASVTQLRPDLRSIEHHGPIKWEKLG